MAGQNKLELTLTLLADGLKAGISNAQQSLENFKKTASGKVSDGLTDDLTAKLKQAEAEIKRAVEELLKLKQAASGKSGALGESLANEIKKAEDEIKRASAELNRLKSNLNTPGGSALTNSAKKNIEDVGKSATGLQSIINRTFADIQATIASVFAVGAVVSFGNKLIETTQTIQDLRIRLSGLTTSSQDYANTEAYLTDLAHRHHKSYIDLASSLGAFLSLEQSGIVTRQQSIQLLEGFSNVASKTGASNVQMGQSVYGLSQALGTGIVNMQDFRQVVEPMPGLANKIADAFGLTVGQLRELIATGTLTSEEFGKKFVVALQNYEGAAQRAGGTITATYADIANSFIEMAKALEKPIASGVMGAVDIGKSTYGWLKDNGDTIVQTLGLIAATMAGKAAAGIATYTKSVYEGIVAEKASIAATVEAAEKRVATKTAFLATAQAKLADAAANTELIKSNLALVQADIRAEAATIAVANATIARTRSEIAAMSATVQTTTIQYLLAQSTQELAAAERVRAASLATTAALGKQAAAVTEQVTAATAAQIKTNHLVVNSAIAQTAAQNALNVALNQSGVAMNRLGQAFKSATAFVGGGFGASVIGLYALYEVLNKVTDAEAKAEEKAKLLEQRLGLINDQIKGLSENEVKLGLDKAKQDTDELHAKIAKLEEFSFSNVANLWGNAGKRQALLDDLDLTGKKIDLLNQKDIELIKNFDATKVPIEQLKTVLSETQTNIVLLGNNAERLKAKLHAGEKLSLYESKQLADDEIRLNAYQAKQSAVEQQIDISSSAAVEARTKKSIAAERSKLKAIEDSIKEVGAITDAETARQTAEQKAALEQRKADISLLAISELEKELLITQAVKASNDAQLLIIQQTSKGKIAAIDEVFSSEIAKTKENSIARNNLDKESLQEKLVVYNAQAKNYEAVINSMISEEVRLAGNSKKLDDERRGIETSYATFKFNLDQVGKGDYEKIENEKVRLNSLVSEQKKAIALGDLEAANRLNVEILEQGKNVATLQKSYLVEETGKLNEIHKKGLDKRHELYVKVSQSDIDETLKITDKAQGEILKVNDKARTSNAQRLTEVKSTAEDAKTALENVKTIIENLNTELQQKHSLKINADTKAVDDAIARIKQPTSSVHTIHQQIVNDAPAHATGGLISGKGTGTSDEIPAMVSNGEYIIKADVVAKHGAGAFDAINYGGVKPQNYYATGGLVGGDDDYDKYKINRITVKKPDGSVYSANSYGISESFDSHGAVTSRDGFEYFGYDQMHKNDAKESRKAVSTSYDAGADTRNSQNRLLDKIKGLKDQAKKKAFDWFDDPLNQVVMSMTAGMTTMGNDEAIVKRNFANNVGEYLRKNNLPMEWRDEYMSKWKNLKTVGNEKLSFEARAQAQIALEDSQNADTVSRTIPTPEAPRITRAAPPVLSAPSFPSLTPQNFSPPTLSAPTASASRPGQMTTVKFVAPDGNSAIAHSSDPNLAKLFDALNTVSGVTRTN